MMRCTRKQKTVRKRRISFPLLPIAEAESYFSDQAKQGYYITTMNGLFYTYEAKEPANMEYRMIMKKGELTDEEIQVYSKQGWEFVCSKARTHLFACKTKEYQKEIVWDKETERKMLNRNIYLFRMLEVVLIIMLLMMCSLLFSSNFIKGSIWFNFYCTIDVLMMGIVGSVVIGITILFYINRLKRERRNLRIKGEYCHHIEYKEARKRSKMWEVLLLVCYALLIINVFRFINSDEEEKDYTAKTNLPIPKLQSIEKKQLQNVQSTYKEEKGVIVWRHIQSEQSANLNTLYESCLQSEYYEITVPFKLDSFMKDLIHFHIPHASDEKLKVIEYEGFSKVYYYTIEEGNIVLVVRKGKRILYMNYRGKTDYIKLLEETRKNI